MPGIKPHCRGGTCVAYVKYSGTWDRPLLTNLNFEVNIFMKNEDWEVTHSNLLSKRAAYSFGI